MRSPDGPTRRDEVFNTRVPGLMARQVDRLRGPQTRSRWVRDAIQERIDRELVVTAGEEEQ